MSDGRDRSRSPIAYLSTNGPTRYTARARGELELLLAEQTGPADEWWLLAEHDDGYVVGHRPVGQDGFTLAGTARLDPVTLFDARVFSTEVELRLTRHPDGGVLLWRRTHRPDDDQVPTWATAPTAPLHARLLLAGPNAVITAGDSGFTRITDRDTGQEALIPVPHPTFSPSMRLLVRQHFAWDQHTGRVWVDQECLAGYTAQEETQ